MVKALGTSKSEGNHAILSDPPRVEHGCNRETDGMPKVFLVLEKMIDRPSSRFWQIDRQKGNPIELTPSDLELIECGVDLLKAKELRPKAEALLKRLESVERHEED